MTVTPERIEEALDWGMGESLHSHGYVLAAALREAQDALREACLHQGLPEDAPPERIAQHFRRNREMREGFDRLAVSPPADEAKP